MIGIAGKPGGGKSAYAERLILEELERPERRLIVTNIPQNEKHLTRYFIEKDIHFDPDWIRVLDWDESALWFLNRVEGMLEEVDVVKLSKEPPKPVFFVLDEAHTWLNSRTYQDKNRQRVLNYVAIHRHLGDEIVWVSQSFNAVDKQIRERCQDYRLCRNWGKESWRGFTKGTGFCVTSYLEPPSSVNHSEMMQWKKNYPLDKKVLNCYHTSLVGTSADLGQRVRGLNYRWIFVGLVAVGILAIVGAHFLPSAVELMIGKKKEQEKVQRKSEEREEQKKETGAESRTPQIEVTGLAGGVEECIVILKGGRVVRRGDFVAGGVLLAVHEKHLLVQRDGGIYPVSFQFSNQQGGGTGGAATGEAGGAAPAPLLTLFNNKPLGNQTP